MKVPPKSDIQVTDFTRPFAAQLLKEVEQTLFTKVGMNYGLAVDCRGRFGSASMTIRVELSIPAELYADLHPRKVDRMMLTAMKAPRGTKVSFTVKEKVSGKIVETAGVIERRSGKSYIVRVIGADKQYKVQPKSLWLVPSPLGGKS